jgi:hypothetical protein
LLAFWLNAGLLLAGWLLARSVRLWESRIKFGEQKHTEPV